MINLKGRERSWLLHLINGRVQPVEPRRVCQGFDRRTSDGHVDSLVRVSTPWSSNATRCSLPALPQANYVSLAEEHRRRRIAVTPASVPRCGSMVMKPSTCSMRYTKPLFMPVTNTHRQRRVADHAIAIADADHRIERHGVELSPAIRLVPGDRPERTADDRHGRRNVEKPTGRRESRRTCRGCRGVASTVRSSTLPVRTCSRYALRAAAATAPSGRRWFPCRRSRPRRPLPRRWARPFRRRARADSRSTA